MAVPGDWTLFYDWDCDGGYGQTPMSITADGRWRTVRAPPACGSSKQAC
jgi:hypothetical protein